MHRYLTSLGLLLALAWPPCAAASDSHSYGNPEAVRVHHLALDLDIDFERRELAGSATLHLRREDPSATELTLDSRDLSIESAELWNGRRWQPGRFTLDAADPVLGSALRVPIDAATERVRLRYRTAPGASGLQWLEPSQTAGGGPFLYTQAQAIHARSFVPLQDSPAVRITYEAVIRVPEGMRAVMSAANDPAAEPGGSFRFEMPQPVPSYLLALAVGELEFQSIGERTGVYAEPAVLEAAAWEFADTQRMLETVEAMYGPYSWGRYDLLILPPAFPWGGMENPRLSFITPTVIAGDRSLVALIAHELAHSWSGNTVTNASWDDVWLNEGFTTYLTYRIMEAVYGEERAAMERVLGYQDLQADIAELPPEDTRLRIALGSRDPDHAFTDVPYEKGALLVTEMEQRIGRPAFDRFLKGYFEHFAFQSLDTDTFLDYVEANLIGAEANLIRPNPEQLSMERLLTWLDQPGIPEGAPQPVADALDRVAAQSAAWQRGERSAAELDTGAWTVHEWLYFLNNLPADMSGAQLAELDASFGLTESGNSEIAHSWLLIAIRHDYRPAWPRLEAYLLQVGRRKLIVPLYRALAETPEGLARARAIYRRAAPGYHVVARHTIAPILEQRSPAQ